MRRWLENHKKITAVMIVAAVFLIVIVWRDKGTKSDTQDTTLKVITQSIGTATLDERISVTGSFEPLVSVEIVPEVSGQLQQLRLADGTPLDVGVVVKEGEVIAVINHDIHLAQLAECQAALEAGRVGLAEAEREKNRMVKLFEGGSATEQAKDKAVTVADLAAAQLKQAQAALDMAKVNVDKATIEAPVTGIVSQKYVDEGNMVGPTTPLVRIVQIDTLKVLGGVSERYLPKLVAGKTQVQIKTDAYPKDEFEGTVYRVAVSVDRITRTGEVEIRVPNADAKLKPGMFARMMIAASQKENVVVIPDSSLIRTGEETYVFIVDNSKALRRKVKLGLSQGQFHEVVEGVSAGDMVVTHGQTQLKDGQIVEVVQETGK
ncbi:MAG: efflux RND transporter periplasmic adaptor subunit [Phycisphaerae bacterium]|jgi:RND family efflux transporter MFP subunit